MNITAKKIRHSIIGVCALLCAASVLIPTAANAEEWQQFRTNFFGYGGDFGEVVRSTKLSNGTFRRFWPVAVSKGYRLKNGFDIFLTADHRVSTDLSYFKSGASFVSSSLILKWFPSSRTAEWQNTFIATQSLIVCSTVSFNGLWMLNNQGGATSSVSAVCPDGRMPASAQAQFFHGVRDLP